MGAFGANIVVGGELDKISQVNRLNSGRLDYPFMPTKTLSLTEGMLLEVPGMIGVFEKTYTPTVDVELTSVAVGANRYHAKDNWSLFIGVDKFTNYVCKTIYTKDVPEGIQLMAVRTIEAGTPITLRFDNQGGQAKYVWANFQMLMDDPSLTGGGV